MDNHICPNCKKVCVYKKEGVGFDENANPVYRNYLYCETCKAKWEIPETPAQQQQTTTKKKKDSTLSIIACVFSGVSVLVPCILVLGYLLAFTGLVLGLVDVGIHDKTKRHIGSYFSICVFAVYTAYFLFAMTQ